MKKPKKPTYIPNGIWKAVKDGLIDSRDLVTWCYMVHRANASGHCWASLRTLASDLKVGVSTVRRSIDRLESSGWISRDGAMKKICFDIEFKLASMAIGEEKADKREGVKMNKVCVQNDTQRVQNEQGLCSKWTTIYNNNQQDIKQYVSGPVKKLVSDREKDKIIFDFKKAIDDLRTQGKNEHADRLAHQLERFQHDRA